MRRNILKRLSLVATAWAFAFTLFAVPAFAQTAGRDCDDNAVIRCGVGSQAELIQKYRENQGGNVHAAFAHHGIANEAALNGMVAGRVTSGNEVFVGDQKVATNAVTMGRQNMPGSTPILNGQFYERPPSASFRSSSLPALVKMDGGTFRYAVIMSCGNSVRATPVQQPKPEQPKPVEKPKKTDFTVIKDVRIKDKGDYAQSVEAGKGDVLQYRVTVRNTGETELRDVVVRDVLPNGLSVESYSNRDLFGQNGYTIGNILPGRHIELIYTATLPAGDEVCTGAKLRNVASAQPKDQQPKQDDAIVQLCKPQPVAPVVQPSKPVEQPKPVQQPVAAPVILPNTGAAAILPLFALTVLSGAFIHRLKEYFLDRL